MDRDVHSMCARVLRREAHHLGFTPNFTIYDDNDQMSLVKKLLKSLDIDDRTMAPRSLLSGISHCKSACLLPEAVEAKAAGFFEHETARLYKAYQSALKELQAMDFDDLIAHAGALVQDQ